MTKLTRRSALGLAAAALALSTTAAQACLLYTSDAADDL